MLHWGLNFQHMNFGEHIQTKACRIFLSGAADIRLLNYTLYPEPDRPLENPWPMDILFFIPGVGEVTLKVTPYLVHVTMSGGLRTLLLGLLPPSIAISWTREQPLGQPDGRLWTCPSSGYPEGHGHQAFLYSQQKNCCKQKESFDSCLCPAVAMSQNFTGSNIKDSRLKVKDGIFILFKPLNGERIRLMYLGPFLTQTLPFSSLTGRLQRLGPRPVFINCSRYIYHSVKCYLMPISATTCLLQLWVPEC